MIVKDRAGFYHSGLDSFDYPRIEYIDGRDAWSSELRHLEFGPFATFAEAREDLVKTTNEAIANLRDLLSNIPEDERKAEDESDPNKREGAEGRG